MFQKLHEGKINWDHTLTGELLAEWKTLVNNSRDNSPISIPRKYLAGIDGEITSCSFCDASTRAYAAVVHLVLKTQKNTVVRFVIAKTRDAPLQPQTIPRLELFIVSTPPL